MSDPLHKKFIDHLRARALATPNSAPPSPKWICTLCKMGSLQQEDAFYRHLVQLHPNELEERLKTNPSLDLEAYKLELKEKAFSLAATGFVDPDSARRTPESGQVSMTGVGFAKLSIASASQQSLGESAPTGAKRRHADDSPGQLSKRGGSGSPAASQMRPVQQPNRRPQPNNNSPQLHRPTDSSASNDIDEVRRTLLNRAPTSTSINSGPLPTPQFHPNQRSHPHAQSSPHSQQRPSRPRNPAPTQPEGIAHSTDARFPTMILQPDSRPISQDQLAAEVKSIYSGLTMVETKCIQVDAAQAAASEKGPVPSDHWRAMISLHRKLLHEHHDFFLASQHPSASTHLKKLAAKYNMPARMWKHAIHSFLELLRHQLPQSLEFMVAFIYLAYQMMSLLYETVRSFEDTWIECLGDLSRYRMAIEEEDLQTREVWANVARSWYSKAADRMPDIGRLYHHLAILARPNYLQQLYLYGRSLISVQAFPAARESIQVLFDPILSNASHTTDSFELSFVKTHALLFRHQLVEAKESTHTVLQSLNEYASNSGANYRENGAHIGVANLASFFNYGKNEHLRRLFEVGNHLSSQQDLAVALNSEEFERLKNAELPDDPQSEEMLVFACEITFGSLEIVLRRHGDRAVHPHVHVTLAFLVALSSYLHRFRSFVPAPYVSQILSGVPWASLCIFLTKLAHSSDLGHRYETTHFLTAENGESLPLPDDHLIRGLISTRTYFPATWFEKSEQDIEGRSIEHPSTSMLRMERILWLGFMLAELKCVDYDPASQVWTPRVDMQTQSSTLPTTPSAVPGASAADSGPEDVEMRDVTTVGSEKAQSLKSEPMQLEQKQESRYESAGKYKEQETSPHIVNPELDSYGS